MASLRLVRSHNMLRQVSVWAGFHPSSPSVLLGACLAQRLRMPSSLITSNGQTPTSQCSSVLLRHVAAPLGLRTMWTQFSVPKMIYMLVPMFQLSLSKVTQVKSLLIANRGRAM